MMRPSSNRQLPPEFILSITALREGIALPKPKSAFCSLVSCSSSTNCMISRRNWSTPWDKGNRLSPAPPNVDPEQGVSSP